MKINRKQFLTQSAAIVPSLVVGHNSEYRLQATEPRVFSQGVAGYNIRTYGARGDGSAKDTAAIQKAIDAAGATGGVVYFPPGKYLSGTLRLKNHLTIEIDAGAVLVASPDEGDFDPYEKLDFESHSDRETTYFHYALLRGEDLQNIALRGQGIIDGNRTKRGGPKPVSLKRCQHITIHGVTLRNAPNYNISMLGCDFVDISGVTILNGYSDGIDPDCCRFVRIANCYIESWDDAIVPKASFALGQRKSTENLTVTNCVLTTACNAFKLGTESSGDFKNIVVNNCAMFGRPETWNRHPISGVAIEMVDGATIDRVAISNITMADIRAPIFVRLGNRGRAQQVPTPEMIRNVAISDVVATGAQLGSSITGIPGYPVRNVSLSNICISTNGGGSRADVHRTIPEEIPKYPEATMFGQLPAYGIFCRHVEDLSFHNVRFHLLAADQRPAIVADDVVHLNLSSISADPNSGEEPILWMHDVRHCFLHGSHALPGTGTFLRLGGERSERIRASGNDLIEARLGFEIEQGVREKVFEQQANFLSKS